MFKNYFFSHILNAFLHYLQLKKGSNTIFEMVPIKHLIQFVWVFWIEFDISLVALTFVI